MGSETSKFHQTLFDSLISFFQLLSIFAFLLPGIASAASELRYITKISDYNQADVGGPAYGTGQQFCGPVAVSNSLQWLMSRSGPQLDLIKTLASKRYMATHLRDGTQTTGILQGIDRYVSDVIGGYKRLQYQGWQFHPKRFSTRIKLPQLGWMMGGVKYNASAWLNVGWYRHDKENNIFHRLGDHWVTLVGYDLVFEGGDSKLIVHDPAPRAGDNFSNEYVSIRKITSGAFSGEEKGQPESAAGFFILHDGMHLHEDADVAIIDGVVILEL